MDVQIGNKENESGQRKVKELLVDAPAVEKSSMEGGKFMVALSLALLTLQNACLVLVMRYVRVRPGPKFLSTTAVVCGEVIKLVVSLACVCFEEGRSFVGMISAIKRLIILQPLDCLKVSVPAIVYMIQNNLLYFAMSNLEAATYQVSYQLKILTTAFFSVLMLGKRLSRVQWISLVTLFIGIAIVQLISTGPTKTAKIQESQNPLLGLIAVVVSCFMSGFAGVYFEKILKGTAPSVWIRNIQLSAFGIVSSTIMVFLKDSSSVWENGFLFGYDWVVWLTICLSSLGGLIVAVVVKYADNILKGFATSAAIILSVIGSALFFDFSISFQFCLGAFFVIVSVYLYGKYPFVVHKKHVLVL